MIFFTQDASTCMMMYRFLRGANRVGRSSAGVLYSQKGKSRLCIAEERQAEESIVQSGSSQEVSPRDDRKGR